MLYQRPDWRLRPWVSHYWLSAGGAAHHGMPHHHIVLPDGCVDLVAAIAPGAATVWLYGTATQRTALAVDPATRYLGVRFLPGQARHFLTMSAAELTDRAEPVSGRDALGLAEARWLTVNAECLFTELDALLLTVLAGRTPRQRPLDNLLQHLLHGPPHTSLVALAAASGMSRRQLERLCRTHVGVSPAHFAMIRRCHRALGMLSQAPDQSLASIAASAGYADQSHLTRELRRFTGLTPGALRRDGPGEDVAFILSGGELSQQNAGLNCFTGERQ